MGLKKTMSSYSNNPNGQKEKRSTLFFSCLFSRLEENVLGPCTMFKKKHFLRDWRTVVYIFAHTCCTPGQDVDDEIKLLRIQEGAHAMWSSPFLLCHRAPCKLIHESVDFERKGKKRKKILDIFFPRRPARGCFESPMLASSTIGFSNL